MQCSYILTILIATDEVYIPYEIVAAYFITGIDINVYVTDRIKSW